MITSDASEENGEFCITVGPVTRTVGIPFAGILSWGYTWLKALAVNWPTGMVA